MLLISLCYISRLIFGVLAFYAVFTPLYFITAALLALSLWFFKWDNVRLFQIVVWVIVYATAGTTTALVIVLIDIGISYFRRSSVVKPEPLEELQDPEIPEIPEIPQIPEIDIETVPVFVQPVQSEEGNTITPA